MTTSSTLQLPPSPTPGVPPPENASAVPPALPRPRWFEAALVVLVAALAFLLGSFPARNSDLWASLAAGRDLVGGTYSPGADPRLPAGAAANPSWLYDVAVYGLYSLAGGPGLLLCKALLVVGLALVLLRLARTGEAVGVPAVCTALALVAMGTRLLLQPATVSYLFLALTLWSLRRDREQARRHLLPPWPLLLLFVVWANVDDWFVLGLSVVALVTTGRVLDEKRAGAGPARPAFRPLSWTLALAAACLVNPAHVRVFTVPVELGWSVTGRALSPFEPAYFATLGPTPAVLAYYPLLVLGLVSFVLNRGRWSWERFLPWLALAVLSAAVARAVPFFAVVGGAVLAWNLQDYLAARPVRRARPGAVLAGRLYVVALGVLLVACAWPGWLQGPPFEPRRWAVETAPALERAAATTRRWHEEGRLGAATRGLHLSPESAYAFAWFCPEDRGILDDHLTALVLDDRRDADWARPLREAGITHVIVYDADRDRLLGSLGRLLTDPDQWPLLSVEGNLAVYGWRDPAARRSDPYAGWKLDLDRLAFHPSDDRKAPHEPSDRAPEVRHWWEAFWKPAPPRALERDEARLYLFHAEALRRGALQRHQVSWATGRLTGLVGAAGSGAGGPASLVDASLRLTFLQPQVPARGSSFDSLPAQHQLAHRLWNQFRLQQDDTPPALLYLAIRAARRALALNPHSAQTHLVLGESYLQLLYGTRERAWKAQPLGQLEKLRWIQASTALNRAIALNPDLAHAHYRLGVLYREMGYLDLALAHLRACQRLAEKGAYPLEVPLADFKDDLARLARDVEDQVAQHAKEAAGSAVLRSASLAMQKGLAGKALELLLASDVSAFGREGMELELELLLKTGRAGDVAKWTTLDQRGPLGGPAYHWMRAQAMAATGHYALAQEEMLALAVELAREARAPNNLPLPAAIAMTVSKVVLDEQTGGESVAHRAVSATTQSILQGRVRAFRNSLREIAETRAVRGLLALEAGEVAVAKAAFLEALTIWNDESAAGRIDFNARAIARDGLRWLAH